MNSCLNIVPDRVNIDGINYRRGFYDINNSGRFYDALIPNIQNFNYNGISYEVKDNIFYRLEHEQFDLVFSYFQTGISDGKTIVYCAEQQWELAKTYYTNNDNFQFYCRIGNITENITNIIIPLKFDELMTFSRNSSGDPFGSNYGVKTHKLPIPDQDESPVIAFSKKSNDGILGSGGNLFYIIDGKMYLSFYDPRNATVLIVVDVPDEYGQYFMELVNKINNIE